MTFGNMGSLPSIGKLFRKTESGRKVVGVPVPGGIDDRLEIVPGRPADHPFRQSIVSNQSRRVTLAAWPVYDLEVSTCDAPNGLEQFFHRRSVAGSEVQSVARTLVQEMLKRAGMRVGEIENVNEIANARSVARIVISAQNLKMRSAIGMA